MPSSIYDLLETRKVSLEQAEVLDLARDIASGLAYIHGQRSVMHPWTIPAHHRDVLQAVPHCVDVDTPRQSAAVRRNPSRTCVLRNHRSYISIRSSF